MTWRRLVLVALLCFGVAASSADAADRKRADAIGSGGAVASDDLNASKAGVEVLRAGGNAIDAAVATAAALGVVRPYVAGVGGGGFLVAYLAKQHRVVTIDGRESCPAACRPSMFLDPASGAPLAFADAVHTGIAIGVPGTFATWDAALRHFGTQPLARMLRPAQAIARRGFRVNAQLHTETTDSLEKLQAFSTTRKLLLTPRGGAPPVGSVLRNPDLARTYERLGQGGMRAFYHGPLAAAIARTVRRPPLAPGTPLKVLPGFMTRADLAGYRAFLQPPTRVDYRGLQVYGAPPPSSGGSTVGEALNILDGYPLGSEPTALALHQYLEASRLAYADRGAYLGDPRYVRVPVQTLLSPAFAASRRCQIDSARAATSPVAPGNPYAAFGGCPPGSPGAALNEPEGSTNNLVVVDREGNAVSYTTTLEQLGGSGMVVPGAGFLLNNEMTDFNFAPPSPGADDPNLAAPGKQPRSSIAPTIVLADGRPRLVLGSPGGATIITIVLQVLINRLDLGMSLPDAIVAPRASQRNAKQTQAEPSFIALPVATTLRDQFGQSFTDRDAQMQVQDEMGAVTAIELLAGGRMLAAAEPVRRGGGSALVARP